MPPKVEYALTARGKKAIPIIEAIRKYGAGLMKEFGVKENK
ncbi:MAG: winged helix-turn-helix transcriptional regulator [Flammeovirgaceae bacterium]|nr:winged helix-turn-helix transcriptional regulator [Flammeovirgaceae bacterium]